jgi:hypothetical protein
MIKSTSRGRSSSVAPRRPFSDCPVGKLTGKVALVAGGTVEIGRAVAIAFAREGADIAIV